MEAIKCPYCGDEAECVRGSEIYRGRPDLRDDWFWVCDPCDARVGCHDGTQKPYGTLANNELRARRMRAHVFFDPLWKKKMDLEGVSKGEARRAAYRWLADKMGLPVEDTHIGHFDLEQCQQVIDLCLPHYE